MRSIIPRNHIITITIKSIYYWLINWFNINIKPFITKIIWSTIISDKIISPISVRSTFLPFYFFNLIYIKLNNSFKIFTIITILNLPYSTSTFYFCLYKIILFFKIKHNPSCCFSIPCDYICSSLINKL